MTKVTAGILAHVDAGKTTLSEAKVTHIVSNISLYITRRDLCPLLSFFYDSCFATFI